MRTPCSRRRVDRSRVVLLGPTHRVAVRGLVTSTVSVFETPLGPVPSISVRSRDWSTCRRWSPGRGARGGTLARGAVAVPADGAGGFLARTARRGPGQCQRRRTGDRAPVGWRRDADRHQHRPVALPAVRAGASGRPCHGGAHPAARQPAGSRAGLRRHAAGRRAAGRARAWLSCRACSICATLATPRATARAWWATARSPSSRTVPKTRPRTAAQDARTPCSAPRCWPAGAQRARRALALPTGPEPRHPALGRGRRHVRDAASAGRAARLRRRSKPRGRLPMTCGHNALAAAFRDSRFEPLRLRNLMNSRSRSRCWSRAALPARSEREAPATLHPGVDGVILEWRDRMRPSCPRCGSSCPTQPTSWRR